MGKTKNEGVRTRRARKLEQLQNEEKVFIEREDDENDSPSKKRTKKLKIKKLPLHTLQQFNLEGDNIKKKLSANQIKLLLFLIFIVLFILQGALINYFR